jgi:hypothetical protein
LPTHIELLSERKVPILRPWQTTLLWLPIHHDCSHANRIHLDRQSTSTSEVLAASCRAPCHRRVGSERSNAGAKGKYGSGFFVSGRMGGGAGQVALDWFDTMYGELAPLGIAFTAIAVITPDPASVQSVLEWASRLRDRVQYVVVENASNPQPDFSYWHNTEQAHRFRANPHPLILSMEFRLPDLENAARQHGFTLGQVADRSSSVPNLQKTSLVLRARAYNRRLFLEFDKAVELLLP